MKRVVKFGALILLLAIVVALAVNCAVRMVVNGQLFRAAQSGQTRPLEQALDQGADPNWLVEGNTSALFLAASNGHLEVVRILLKRGADPNIKDYQGRTALDVASSDEIKLLLKRAMGDTR